MQQDNSIIKTLNGYYIKEKNETQYRFLPFEKFYSLDELVDIIKKLKQLEEI